MIFNRHQHKTDEELMVLVKRKNHQAFSILYQRYADRLNAFFFRMLWSDREMSEDYVHDLFSKVINKPELYDESYKVKPWLFQIATNMCKNAYRKRAFEVAFRGQHTVEEGYQARSEEKVNEVILTDQVHQLLDKMEEERKMLFLLRYQQELPIETIAAMMELSEGTVKSRLFYTRREAKSNIKILRWRILNISKS